MAGWVAMVILAVGAPAAALVSVSTSNTLELQVGERVLHVRASRKDISGPRIQLRLSPSGLRGNAYGSPVRLRWAGDRVVGEVGPDALQLEVRQVPEGVVVRGAFAGQESNLRIWPTTLSDDRLVPLQPGARRRPVLGLARLRLAGPHCYDASVARCHGADVGCGAGRHPDGPAGARVGAGKDWHPFVPTAM